MRIISDRSKSNRTILALDTVSPQASIALYHKGKTQQVLLGETALSQAQARLLLPMSIQLLMDQGLTLSEVDTFAIIRGPGSFTGLRIGLATVQGLLLATKANFYAPSTFEVWAYKYRRERSLQDFVVALDTRRDSYYSQIFNDKGAVKEGDVPIVRTRLELEKLGIPIVEDSENQPLASLLAEMALSSHQESELTPLYVHTPIYARSK